MTKNDTPAFWIWMGEQHLNSDPDKAAAAIAIRDRWGYGEWYNHARVLRALSSEDSEYFRAAQSLADDYARAYGIAPDKQIKTHGAISPLVPTMLEQCEHVNKRGLTCGRDAVPGTGVCGWHGGQWITEAERAEVVREISGRLIDVSDRALRVIIDMMDQGKSEKVRLEAALAVLDRIGAGPTSKIELDVTTNAESAADLVLERLEAMRAAAVARVGDDIVDAEVVAIEESPGVSAS